MSSTTRYVIFAYLIFGVVLWTTLAKLFAWLGFTLDIEDPALLGSQFRGSTLAGLLLAVGIGVFFVLRRSAFAYCEQVVDELRKVTWPKRQETQSATVVVIITTLAISLVLGVFDALWAKMTSFIYT